MGTLHDDLWTLMIVSHWILCRMRNVSDKSCIRRQNTHFMVSTFFQRWCCLWNNMEKYGRTEQATDISMVHAFCLLDNYGCWLMLRVVIHIAFPQQQLLCKHTSMLHCTYITSVFDICFLVFYAMVSVQCVHTLVMPYLNLYLFDSRNLLLSVVHVISLRAIYTLYNSDLRTCTNSDLRTCTSHWWLNC